MDTPIETAASLYREMKNRGLHLRWENGRDDALIAQLADRLGCDDLNLQAFLDASNLLAQEFMIQFIDIAQPFALMFNDIWDYLATYAAYESSESIAVRFGFPDSHEHSVVTLEQFRRYVERIEQIILSVHLWPENAIFTLYKLYRILLGGIDRGEWNYNYEEGKPYTLSKVASGGHPLDEIVIRIQRLFQKNIDAFVKKAQVNIEGISEPELDSGSATGFPTRRLTADLLPFWKIVFEKYDQVPDKSKTEALAYFEKETRPLLGEKKRQGVGIVREALDIIDLPFWRHRWHTYEVWATVVTLRALKEYRPIPRINENSVPIDGYEPAIIADLEAEEYRKACVAVQVQTPYIVGRRRAIRPDLRVCFSDRFEAEETAAIVEFKQRSRLSRREIAELAKAYLGGSPRCGGVIVLNYDRVPVDVELPHNTLLIGDVNPCNHGAVASFTSNLKCFLKNASLQPLKEEMTVVLLDVSGSMGGSYSGKSIQDALRRLLSVTKVNVLTFNDGLTSGKKLRGDSNTNLSTSGGTDLGKTLDDLESSYGVPDRLLVVTDGAYHCPDGKLERILAVRECMPEDIQQNMRWLLGAGDS